MISVIIPVYNVQEYLRQCVDSVICQTYGDLQIILVDDGSTDDCPGICDEYAGKDKRVTVLHSVNGGLSKARNLGLSIATGEYITFIDSDDFVHPQMMEIFMHFSQRYDADMVTCSCERENEFEFSKKLSISSIKESVCDGKKDFDQILGMSNVVAWGRLYKKNCLAGFKYPEGKLHEDEYIHRILYKCGNVICLPCKLYFYRIRNGSTMAVFKKERIYWALEAFEDRINFAMENGWSEIYHSAFDRYALYCKDMYEGIQKSGTHNYDDLLPFLRNSLNIMIKKHGKRNFDKEYVAFSKGDAYYKFFVWFWNKTYPLSNFMFRVKRKLRKICKK